MRGTIAAEKKEHSMTIILTFAAAWFALAAAFAGGWVIRSRAS